MKKVFHPLLNEPISEVSGERLWLRALELNEEMFGNSCIPCAISMEIKQLTHFWLKKVLKKVKKGNKSKEVKKYSIISEN